MHSYSPTGFDPEPIQLTGRLRVETRLVRQWSAVVRAVLDIDEKLVPSARADRPGWPRTPRRRPARTPGIRPRSIRTTSSGLASDSPRGGGEPSRMLFVSLDARDASPDHARLRGRATPTARPGQHRDKWRRARAGLDAEAQKRGEHSPGDEDRRDAPERRDLARRIGAAAQRDDEPDPDRPAEAAARLAG